MTHIAIQEALNGSAVNWMEKVSDRAIPGADQGLEVVGQPPPRYAIIGSQDQ